MMRRREFITLLGGRGCWPAVPCSLPRPSPKASASFPPKAPRPSSCPPGFVTRKRRRTRGRVRLPQWRTSIERLTPLLWFPKHHLELNLGPSG